MGKGMTVVDAASTEFVVNQATFYLTFLVSLGAAAAIIVQTVRGINGRIKKAKEEADAKAEAEHAATRRYVDDKMQEINQMKERIEYIYRKIIDDFFNADAANKRQRGEQRK
jgi:uncharacterized membrane protein (DUF106 family)